MKMNLRNAASSELWRLVAFAVAELAQRNDASTSPRVEIRRVNGGTPQATISVELQEQFGDVPPLLCIGNATLDPKRIHHFESFVVPTCMVQRVNRLAYDEAAKGVF